MCLLGIKPAVGRRFSSLTLFLVVDIVWVKICFFLLFIKSIIETHFKNLSDCFMGLNCLYVCLAYKYKIFIGRYRFFLIKKKILLNFLIGYKYLLAPNSIVFMLKCFLSLYKTEDRKKYGKSLFYISAILQIGQPKKRKT